MMKNLLCACASLLLHTVLFSQSTRTNADRYPSLLWEITGNGISRPSYLFGTMHVSNKMVFHLSDSFYLAIKNAEVVALETNPATWQEDFSRYDLEGEGGEGTRRSSGTRNGSAPQDYLTINALRLPSFEKAIEAGLYSSPSVINSFLYRNTAEAGSDFEEDTYLDLHIYQAGRKLGKKICGVEDFHGSMRLVKEAYADAAKEKRTSRNYNSDEEFSYARMEEAYRTGNLDLLDTINKVNSQSAAFDEKFLYKRNDIQAASIDSLLRTGVKLFAGVGAAHLPGQRGVIEILRRQGYRLRPVKMKERDRRHKESIERIRVPVTFSEQVAEDGLFSLRVPGKLYSFGQPGGSIDMRQYADMVNGSYYMVTRIATNAAIMGQSEKQVREKLDSVLYENIPGRILSKQAIIRNGYRGYDITNRTRRGDRQRYQIFVTPFEVLMFKMSGNGEYVSAGNEAAQFFGSIQLKEHRTAWKKWSPAYGGFVAEFPHPPVVFKNSNRVYAAWDAGTGTAVEVLRTDVHNYDFVEEDSFDLNLMEESFAASSVIDTCLSRQWTSLDGYKSLSVTYRYKNGSTAMVNFLVQGPHYYTVVAAARKENRWMHHFLRSFTLRPFVYGEALRQVDTALKFTVTTPVQLEKEGKLSMYPEDAAYGYNNDNADDSLVNNGNYQGKLVEDANTGQKVYVSLYRHSPYYFKKEGGEKTDSTAFYREWTMRNRRQDTLKNGLVVLDYELGSRLSSRLLRTKEIGRDGMGYKLESQGDTLSPPSAFVSSFFATFTPVEDFAGVNVGRKKTALFFQQFFSSDTLQHRRAVKNIGAVAMDAADYPQLTRAIEALNWNEKAYLEVKKSFIGKLASMPTKEAAAYLRTLYATAGDTVELQYAALETLLRQKTKHAYQVFGEIMQNDPPVLNLERSDAVYANTSNRNRGWRMSDETVGEASNGSFFDNLTDSLELTAGIFQSLLPLINIDDYQQPVMALARILVDSSLLQPSAYESYLPRFMLEAKQALKKQLIREKNKAIEKKKKDGEGEQGDVYRRDEGDFGNQRLSLYATLLLPFRDRHPQVVALFDQLLKSSDDRLRYNTAMLLLRNGQALPDTVISGLASLDDWRWELYADLKRMGKASLFPNKYKTQLHMAQSRLATLTTYGKPDTLAFWQKIHLQHKGREGVVYVFRYKDKKEDNTWKLATAGLFPRDSTQVEWTATDREEDDYDFTRLTGTKFSTEISGEKQGQQLKKRLLYSRRFSAARFYDEEHRFE